MDLSVAATPLYFGAMALERRTLQRRAAVEGRSAADYLRPDTAASLAMGVGSLAVPICQYLGRSLVPRRGRFGTVLVGAVAAAAAVTTVADVVVRRARRDAMATEADRRLRRRARRVAEVGGVATLAGAGLVVTATTAHLSGMQRQWAKGRHRDLGNGVVAWTAAMVGWDFVYYWNHRFMHEVRAMWAIHVPHHSSEHYNLGTALRQPVASAFGVWVPYSAMARMGVRPSLIEYSRGLNLIYQFWIHTDTIRTLGRSEAVLNTPSHHRVHHGSNRRYLDRNHAGILIVWDRLFGTFQRELPDDPVVYGLTKNIDTYHWWTVATHEYRQMFRDIADAECWRDRFGFVLRGPGWAFDRRAAMTAAAGAVEVLARSESGAPVTGVGDSNR
jgi:sterol desaturase/sphingolipid hydroxylase (fatty acid hydroxylase superfamily)